MYTSFFKFYKTYKEIIFDFHLIYYLSSMVIRDLTLRSAASFGSFHLIRLLYDEYMFYLIEQRVAKAVNKTPVAVMATGKLADPQGKQGITINENLFGARQI